LYLCVGHANGARRPDGDALVVVHGVVNV
jgi:hypothetical protein